MAVVIAVLAYIVIIPKSNVTAVAPSQQALAVNGWKTYSNTKYGISFQYPSTWQLSNEGEPTGTNGGIKGLSLIFTTDAQELFTVDYRLAPTGIDDYQTLLSGYNTSSGWYREDKSTIHVDGTSAIKGVITDTDYNSLKKEKEPMKTVYVDLLDKKQGSVGFSFTTPTNSMESTELNEFNQLLSTFKFI